MRLDIHSPRLPLATEHRAQTERLVGFALSRLNGLVQRVEVHLEPAARGGELACRVQVHLGGATVVVDDSDADVSALIQRSVARAGQAAQRHLAAARRSSRAWLGGGAGVGLVAGTGNGAPPGGPA